MSSSSWNSAPIRSARHFIASKYCGADPVSQFTERACASGTLGLIPSHNLMPLVLANALRLTKFGA